MPRGKKPSVRYWDSRGGYGCWIDGTQHILAKGPDDARVRKFPAPYCESPASGNEPRHTIALCAAPHRTHAAWMYS